MLNQSDLNQFHGDLVRWKHQLCPSLLYTPGIKYLMEKGEAYWLLDAQSSHINNDILCLYVFSIVYCLFDG